MLAFAYSTINWDETPDMDDMFAQIAKWGWRAVEIFAQPLNWLGPHTLLQDQLQRHGLVAATLFGAVAVPGTPQQLTYQFRRIDYAAAVGADTYGIVGGGRLRPRKPTIDEYRDLARTLETLAVYGAERGVTVAYHPHVGTTIETESEIDTLLEQTSSLMLCLDVSHVGLVGEDPVKQLRKYRDRLGYVHLKDWGRGSFTELGQGTIGLDFQAILQELDQWPFKGWIVVEQSRSEESPEASMAINSRYLTDRGWSIGNIKEMRAIR
ncbi:MAG: sugar phosphate isomerase/epimerase [Firmicutes bacterium]|nr:sugar phosphate isomerase/epimerase [Bacillota bacterium]